ncbi:hypothetical protein ASPBRDRAFT_49531 [Aspergillus brasiliensis CBS 101740]|uniref:Uncharacterized protein n=1 Tax=Aspergillus brasiliensis (strain CBS 101740 / IMI 381727 / IBT 21946) TaxID=767769 RepID=A0A1L9U243_ASPBC|nr:hypothetical protein ASPBRDRAFT_49531 [Aspergillus brasiliensis CBS 101740]
MSAEIRDICEKIHKVSKEIRVLGRLDTRKSKLVSSAIRVMTTSQSERPFKVYHDFLCDLLRAAGSSMVILSSASLGKDKIVQLKAECRTALIDYFACHVGSLDSPALSALVAAFGVPRNEFYYIFIGGREGQPALSSHTQQVNSVEQNEQTAAAMAKQGTDSTPVQRNAL